MVVFLISISLVGATCDAPYGGRVKPIVYYLYYDYVALDLIPTWNNVIFRLRHGNLHNYQI